MSQPVTPEWVQEQVRRIGDARGDDERAHSEENALHQTVLEAIARGYCENPQECARLALETRNLNFSRWCA